jgi:deoxyribonuclease V
VLTCVDVDYRPDAAVAAAVSFARWSDATPVAETTLRLPGAPAEYEPGQFYKRELPPLLALLRQVPSVALVIVDGYVTLGNRPGLGRHLHDALGVIVVGVAKSEYRGASEALPLLRGKSRRPLWITAVGVDVAEAARGVAMMAGESRIPALLKRVDRLARSGG